VFGLDVEGHAVVGQVELGLRELGFRVGFRVDG